MLDFSNQDWGSYSQRLRHIRHCKQGLESCSHILQCREERLGDLSKCSPGDSSQGQDQDQGSDYRFALAEGSGWLSCLPWSVTYQYLRNHSSSAGVRLPWWWWWSSSSSSSWFCGVLASHEQGRRNSRRIVAEISNASPVWNYFASEIDLGNIIQAKYGTESHIRCSGRGSCCCGSPTTWVSMSMVRCRQ
jgi:hypothetical protein